MSCTLTLWCLLGSSLSRFSDVLALMYGALPDILRLLLLSLHNSVSLRLLPLHQLHFYA